MTMFLLVFIFSCCCAHSQVNKHNKDDPENEFWKENGNFYEHNQNLHEQNYNLKENFSDQEYNDLSDNETSSNGFSSAELETKYMQLSNCSLCMMREETKALRIEAIKTQILSKLKLKTAPNITIPPLPKVSILHQIIDQNSMMPKDSPWRPDYEMQEEDDNYHASTEKVMIFRSDVPKHLNIPDELRQHVVYFKITHKMARNKPIKANIWIYTRPSKQETTLILNISKISPSINNTHKINLTNIRIKKLDPNKRTGYWSYYEIRKVVSHWFRHPKENYGIAVQVMTHDGKNLVVNKPNDGEETLKPFIELRVNEGDEKRMKRMIGLDCLEKANQPYCCRYPLMVDFDDFGWDWIIAPKRYEANYCAGECPFLFLQNYPYTHLVQQTNPHGSPGPCCAPSKMSAISMLHFDDNQNIIYSKLPGMVVDKCGCF